MGITRPTGEQLRFRSQFTGDHVLDTYLEASEKGNRQLSDLLDDLFDSSGVFRAANFEFRFDEATDKIQFRAGNFASSTAGWTDITTFFKITGTFNSSTTYNNFDLITLSTKDIYIVHGLSSGTTFADEAAVIASSNTDKLVDVSEARDWAKKTDGIVSSTDYSAKAWAIGGTGVTNSATGGAAKEWATKTSGTVDGTNFSAKYWATHTDVVNVSTNIASVTSVASAISNVNTVSTNISNVNTTASSIANVNTVAAELGTGQDVTVVAANITNVGTVASDISNVNTAAGSIANVNTVAGSITNVNTVSGSIANVNTTATNIADVNTVATEINNNNLQTVAADIQAVIDVANDLNEATSEIDVVANNIANVNTVGTNIANVNTVAGISADVTTAATNSVAFNNTYLGAQSSAPTADPDGSALDLGDLYFDTTTNTMKVYSASGWIAAGSSVNGTADRFTYTATASQTTFTGNDDNTNSLAYDAGFLDVYMNGVKLVNGSDFTATNGTSIVLASAAVANDTIEIIAYGTFVLADHLTETQSDAKYVELAGDTMTGNLGIGISPVTHNGNAKTLHVDGGANASELRLTNTTTGSASANGFHIAQVGDTSYVVQNENAPLNFYTNAAYAAQFDASGNFLVGKTSASSTSTGAELRASGQGIFVALGTNPILANRRLGDGDIAQFRIDGTTVGSIGGNNGRIAIYSANAGLHIASGILPSNSTGARSDNTVDIGNINFRFKDLHLSGTVNAASLNIDGGTIKLDGNYPTGTNNVALGDESLRDLTTGGNNTALGRASLTNIETGSHNTGVGQNSVTLTTSGSYNTGIGSGALQSNTTASGNTAMGYQSLYSNTTGSENTALGYQAGYGNTTNDQSTTIGYFAGTGGAAYQTAVGYKALYASTAAATNEAFGWSALLQNTTGFANAAYGSFALYANTTGEANTAVGKQSLLSNTTASNNTAVGYQAGYSNTTGIENTFVGRGAANANTTGQHNAVFGDYAYGAGTTGNYNTAIGKNALRFNTTASNNTAVGYQSGYANTTGTDNISVGRLSLYTNTTGSYSAVLGSRAGYSMTTGGRNTLMGYNAGQALTTGTQNTFIGANDSAGYGSGHYVTTGSKNTIIGAYDGNQGGLDIRTSNNNIVLSDGDGNPRGYYHGGLSSPLWVFETPTAGQNSVHFKNSATSAPYGIASQLTGASPNNTAQYFYVAYDAPASSTKFIVYSNGNVVNVNNSYGAISDVKLKENIVDSGSQWDDIKALRVRKYSMKADNLDAPNQLGVIAQEVEDAGMNGLVFETPDQDFDTKEDLGTVTKQVNYSILYMKAVKALQEAMDRIEQLEARVATLEG